MNKYEQNIIVFSLYTLVLDAILGLIAVILIGNMPSIQETQQWAEWTSSGKYALGFDLLIYAYLLGIIGFYAIHRLFGINKKDFNLTFWGMILAIFGSAIPVASIGINAFVNPALARMYLEQGTNVAALLEDIFSPGTIIFLLFSGVYYFVGIVLFGIVLWKSNKVNLRVASILLILHSLLIIMPEQIYVNLLSWGCLLVSSILLVIYATKHYRDT